MSGTGWFVIGLLAGVGGAHLVYSGKLSSISALPGGEPYAPSPRTSPAGTMFRDYLSASYSELRAAFGSPHYVDNRDLADTFNEWRFRGPNGAVFTIYDRDDSGNASAKPNKRYKWHIGGNQGASVFKRWVTKQLGR